MRRRPMISGLWQALKRRYKPPEWAIVREVPDSTGFAGRGYADALALNLWPSRGLILVGFELKTERNDWLRELKNPAKAERFATYCDEWWLITTEDVAKDDEIPATWGWLKYRRNSKSLRALRTAERKPQQPSLPRALTAALVRRACEAGQDEEELKAARAEAYAEGQREGTSKRKASTETAMLEQQIRALKRELDDYKTAAHKAGMQFKSWEYSNVAEYITLLRRIPPHSILSAYERAAQLLFSTQRSLTEAISDFKASTEDRKESKA